MMRTDFYNNIIIIYIPVVLKLLYWIITCM